MGSEDVMVTVLSCDSVPGSAAVRATVTDWGAAAGIDVEVIDVCDDPETVRRFGAMLTPCVVVTSPSGEVGRVEGRCGRRRLRKLLHSASVAATVDRTGAVEPVLVG